MSATDYLLVVLTHGRSPHLARVLESFCARVSPDPAETLVWVDGPDLDDAAYDAACGRGWDFTLAGGFEQQGFCGAVRDAWEEAAATDYEYVFWLENDFVFDRPVELRDLAVALDDHPGLAQVALCRQACNEQERAAGGLVESRPGDFEARSTGASAWLEHRAYLTTNPSLMRRDFMAANPWPTYPEQCEGRFGLDLRGRGYTFGLWGSGEPWVQHIGVRDGGGY